MTYTKIDKVMKSYWDAVFKDSYFINDVDCGDDCLWSGLSIPGNEIRFIGYPNSNEGTRWYYDDNDFPHHIKSIFSLDLVDLNMALMRYLNNRFNLHIKRIS